MTIDTWLDHATADAAARGLPGLRPLLEALAGAMAALRDADWNDDLGVPAPVDPPPDVR
jgi:hypothetical protein